MPTSTVEDYLKAIWLEEQSQSQASDRPDEDLVTMGHIAQSLAVAPGTVTAMVKTLVRAGLVSYEPYSGVRLSAEGVQVAAKVVRRHRLTELFLVEILGFDWSEVHEEAERLEHAMSEKLIDRIDQLLGYPQVDPHGDPIPDAAGQMRESDLVRLTECPPGGSVTVARVSDQDEQFLRFVDRHGLKPGTRIEVQNRDVQADAVTVKPERMPQITIGGEAAAKLWIERPSPKKISGAG
jgi:DtxR family Mn-dependent transcriptional regulator